MAYVPGFKYDVFISYGHVDDDAPTKDWVATLHTYVLGKLKSICSKDVEVWRDTRLGQDRLDDAVKGAISQSAVFISVLSPGFAQGDWCTKEAGWFLAASGPDAMVDGKSRLVRAVKTPLVDVPWPAGLDDGTLHYRFYDTDEQSQLIREYSAVAGHLTNQEFEGVCSALTQAIADVLRRMRRLREARQPTPAPRRTIFVGDATRDVRDLRDSVVKELEDRGCLVLRPEIGVDDGIEAITAAISSKAALADVAVHILGRFYGSIPEGSSESIVALQARLVQTAAAERPVDRPITQIVWQPEGLNNIEPPQAALIEALSAQESDAHRVFDFITGPVTRFKDALLDVIARRAAPAAEVRTTPRSVFLLCNLRDLTDPELQSIRAWLLDRGFPADVPVYQGDPNIVTRLEEESIIEAAATVIYYGTAEDTWVRQKRKVIQKAWAKQPSETRRARAVYLARPEDDVKQAQYRGIPRGMLQEVDLFPPLRVLGDCGPFNPSKLGPLLSDFDGSGSPP